jgi:hypothetical protein
MLTELQITLIASAQILEKECRQCQIVKPLDDFRKRKNGNAYNQCRECQNYKNKTLKPYVIESVIPTINQMVMS